MNLDQLVNSDSVLCNAHARSKKHCLEILSELLARPNPDLAYEDIFSELIARERLGCTSLSQGVAFPHCRVNGARKSTGALIKLSSPVEFDSSDGEEVDLIFGLMVPAKSHDNHKSDIARISEILSDQDLRNRLRNATTSSDLFDEFISAQDKSLDGAQIARGG
jgi:PTS system nitrogen regulatory IIA component